MANRVIYKGRNSATFIPAWQNQQESCDQLGEGVREELPRGRARAIV